MNSKAASLSLRERILAAPEQADRVGLQLVNGFRAALVDYASCNIENSVCTSHFHLESTGT